MDKSDIINAISDNVLSKIPIYDLIDNFVITVEAKDIHGKMLVASRGHVTGESLDCANFPIQEEEFKELWYNIIKKSKETMAGDL